MPGFLTLGAECGDFLASPGVVGTASETRFEQTPRSARSGKHLYDVWLLAGRPVELVWRTTIPL